MGRAVLALHYGSEVSGGFLWDGQNSRWNEDSKANEERVRSKRTWFDVGE